ncbi:MAG: serine/threonine-protein phosphatase [Gammaproteobacteria bacterium]|nr:MAG: serine/threonine-protein phosphatase [Gammaproteobacteria bacterium]
MPVRWQSAAQSHRGACRKHNEDAVLARPDVGLWAVADGMGGHEAGEIASQRITNALAEVTPAELFSDTVDRVDDTLDEVNDGLRWYADEHCEGRIVGSTVVTMLAGDGVGVALWAGDSRLYRLRDSELCQITRDHNPIADLLDDGLVSEKTAVESDTNIVTRAVGGQLELFLDVAVFDLERGDTFLLCSDGLYREVGAEEIGDLMSRESLTQGVMELIDLSLQRGARDNVSVVLSRLEI